MHQDIAQLLSTRSTLGHVGEYEITDDPARVDLPVIHRFLSLDSYWRRGISVERVGAAMAMSLPISVHLPGPVPTMVGLVRVVTDTVTHAWLDDLFVLDAHRGRGLGSALVRAALDHPAVREASLQMLLTADAHELYSRYGFGPSPFGNAMMVRHAP